MYSLIYKLNSQTRILVPRAGDTLEQAETALAAFENIKKQGIEIEIIPWSEIAITAKPGDPYP